MMDTTSTHGTHDPFDDPREHLEGPKRWYGSTLAAIHARPSTSDDQPTAPPDPSTVYETHTSQVVLLGDRAYKIRKPLRLPFIDLSTPAARERIAHREIELNRRLAPDVYLGVLDVHAADAEDDDHIVVMRRLPADRRLSAMIAAGRAVVPCITEIARRLAAFHAGADRSPTIDGAATPSAIRARWAEDLGQLRAVGGDVLEEEAVDRVATLAFRYIEGREALFRSRIADGRIVDGHGDLLTDDVYCLPDGPRILDCLEFDDELRYGDALADVAFLAMDLEQRGRLDLATRFLDAYSRFSNDTPPTSLCDLYIAHRALVRSKVACVRAGQGDGTAPRTARALLALAEMHLRHAAPRMVLIGGLPGTGKSTVATAVSDATGAVLLRSDEIRKDLAGRAHGTVAGHGYRRGIYSPDMDQATYDEMARRAGDVIAAGRSVVLDASWQRERDRGRARTVAHEGGAEAIEVRLVASPTLAAWRMERRAAAGSDCSDATPDIAARMAVEAEPWPEATTIGSTSSERAVHTVLRAYHEPAPVGSRDEVGRSERRRRDRRSAPTSTT